MQNNEEAFLKTIFGESYQPWMSTSCNIYGEFETFAKNGGRNFNDFVQHLFGGQNNYELQKLQMAIKICQMQGTSIDDDAVTIMSGLIKSGMTSESAKSILNNLKLDNDGKLEFAKFIRSNEFVIEDLQKIFRSLNTVVKAEMKADDYNNTYNYLITTYNSIASLAKNITDTVIKCGDSLTDVIKEKQKTIDYTTLYDLKTKFETISELVNDGLDYNTAQDIYNESKNDEQPLKSYVNFVSAQTQNNAEEANKYF